MTVPQHFVIWDWTVLLPFLYPARKANQSFTLVVVVADQDSLVARGKQKAGQTCTTDVYVRLIFGSNFMPFILLCAEFECDFPSRLDYLLTVEFSCFAAWASSCKVVKKKDVFVCFDLRKFKVANLFTGNSWQRLHYCNECFVLPRFISTHFLFRSNSEIKQQHFLWGLDSIL